MVKINEHKQEIEETKKQIQNTNNPQRKKQLIKHLHRLQKQLSECNMYLVK